MTRDTRDPERKARMLETTRRDFLKTAGLGAAGLTVGCAPRLATSPRRSEHPVGMEGVELAIATIVLDGFGDENFEHAFRIVPQVGIENVEFTT